MTPSIRVCRATLQLADAGLAVGGTWFWEGPERESARASLFRVFLGFFGRFGVLQLQVERVERRRCRPHRLSAALIGRMLLYLAPLACLHACLFFRQLVSFSCDPTEPLMIPEVLPRGSPMGTKAISPWVRPGWTMLSEASPSSR